MKRRNSCCWRRGANQTSPWNRDWPDAFFRGRSSTLEILKIRYANGEINKEEYDRMKKDIE